MKASKVVARTLLILLGLAGIGLLVLVSIATDIKIPQALAILLGTLGFGPMLQALIAITVVIGVIAILSALGGWLGIGAKQQAQNLNERDLLGAFLGLSLLRKAVALLATLAALFGIFGFIVGLTEGMFFIRALYFVAGAVVMTFLAWPTLITNIRATTGQSWKRYLVVTTVTLALGTTVVLVYRDMTAAERLYEMGQRQGVYSSYTYYGDGPKESNVQENFDNELSGRAQWWHENGERWAEEFYVQGRPHGHFQQWHDNGQLAWEAHYFDGEMQEPAMAWDINGEPASAANIQPQSLAQLAHEREQEAAREAARANGGTYLGTFRDGRKQVEESFDASGERHGIERHWSWHGHLLSETSWVNGRLEGMSSRYYDNGQLQEQRLWMKSRRTTTWSEWYRNGQLKRESGVVNGERFDRGWNEDGTFIGDCETFVSPCQLKREED